MIRKTKTVRLTEIVDIRRKLRNLGYDASHSEVKRLFDVLSAFVENGDYVKDKFVIDGYDRVIHVLLLPRMHAQNVVRIRNETLSSQDTH